MNLHPHIQCSLLFLTQLCRTRLRQTLLCIIMFCLATTLLQAQPAPPINNNAPAKQQAQLHDPYAKLPLSFEPNQGQSAAPVKFLSRTGTYTLYLTNNEAVLQSHPGNPKNSSPRSRRALETQALASQKLCHPDRSEAEWRDLVFPPITSTEPLLLNQNLDDAALQQSISKLPLPSADAALQQSTPMQPSLSNDAASQTLLPPLGGAALQPLISTPPLLGGAALQRCDNAAHVTTASAAEGNAAPATLHMKLTHANPAPNITGTQKLPGTTNYFLGNDPKNWTTNIPTYAQVKYESIYPGIDLIYYGNQRQLEYDFIVAPQANPNQISFTITGANKITQTAQGDLLLKLNDSNQNEQLSWHKPTAYQKKNGARQEIPSTYRITNHNQITFQLAKYDRTQPLYIDPLIYSTYLGGSSYDFANAIAVDSEGNAYLTGWTYSTNFPVTTGAFQTNCDGCAYGVDSNAFVTKINATGTGLVYSTYLGGSTSNIGYSIAVDNADNAYVTGITYSSDFPITPGAFQTTCNPGGYCSAGSAFITKLNPAGSALEYSTFLGGSDQNDGYSIAVDSSSNASVTGYTSSNNFPVTPGAFQTTCKGCGDVFVSKFNPAGSALLYSTYLGGSGGGSWAYGVASDDEGHAYVTGHTNSTNFPVTPGAFETTGSGGFVTQLNPSGTALIYSTYLVGAEGAAIAVDSAGNAYVTGLAGAALQTTPGAFQTLYQGGFENAFVSKLNPSGSALVYSTFLAGKQKQYRDFSYGSGIAIDVAGNVYVTGTTTATNFPTTPGAFQTHCQNGCGEYGNTFITRFNAAGSALVYSTYLGGSGKEAGQRGTAIALDSAHNAYVTGWTSSPNFPTTPGAFQTICNGGTNCNYYGDAFVSKLNVAAVTTTTLTSSPNPSTYGDPVTFTAVITSAAGAPPDGETISFMKGKTILGTATLTTGTAAFTTSTLKVGTTSVTATYPGDSNFAPSKSKPLKQVVNPAAN